MRLCRFLPLVLAGLLATPGFLGAQSGPKKESGDTAARPKKKSDTPDAEKPPEATGAKIPSRMQKKPGEGAKADGPTFRSDNLTVTVDVGVLDNRGRFIPGFRRGISASWKTAYRRRRTGSAPGKHRSRLRW